VSIGDYFRILAPTKTRYLDLLPHFTQTPEAAAPAASAELGLGDIFRKAMEAARQWIAETWATESLPETTSTSASNESSVVQFWNFDGRKVLLTGDVGIQGLEEAADYAAALQLGLPGLRFMQVPHHGSRHNISPRVLNRFIGDILPDGQTRVTTAYASVAKGTETHPRKVVSNAFIRRGATVVATAGTNIWHSHGMPSRADYSAVTPVAFSNRVEG
jgi:beta-lactamase superfamily II metal-dependent hydrolase